MQAAYSAAPGTRKALWRANGSSCGPWHSRLISSTGSRQTAATSQRAVHLPRFVTQHAHDVVGGAVELQAIGGALNLSMVRVCRTRVGTAPPCRAMVPVMSHAPASNGYVQLDVLRRRCGACPISELAAAGSGRLQPDSSSRCWPSAGLHGDGASVSTRLVAADQVWTLNDSCQRNRPFVFRVGGRPLCRCALERAGRWRSRDQAGEMSLPRRGEPAPIKRATY